METTHYFGPQLVVIENINGKKQINKFNINIQQVLIGRFGARADCQIQIKSPLVSALHGMLTIYNGKYYYNDCSNTNGTFVDGEYIFRGKEKVSPAIEIRDGSILAIGSSADINRVFMIFSLNSNEQRQWKLIPITENNSITIGRADDNIIYVPNVTASRRHATVFYRDKDIILTDNNSYNGTYVNGIKIQSKVLKDGDCILIGATKLFYVDGSIIYNDYKVEKAPIESVDSLPEIPKQQKVIRQGEGFEVIVNNITRTVKCKKGTGINGSDKKNILEDVTLTINAGDFVAICGGSGAGKTTFMNCINGFEPATSGEVLVNGTDLYKNYSMLKNYIGYVPQQDIVHDNLTLESMLTYTAKLRLQSDITNQEIKCVVDNVLEMVDLSAQRDTFIKKLSGGQRKRASIAVELVSDPSLFFLDEPTSGLDPEAETHLMHRLKKLSDEKGKTVIVITHTLQNIHLFDKVIFLAPGGKLCFYGSPEDAKVFFDVDNLADAYEKISNNVEKYVNKFKQYRKEK